MYPREEYDHKKGDVSEDEGILLYKMIKKYNLKSGLEIGHRHGYSTLFIAKALEENDGDMVTVDIKDWYQFNTNMTYSQPLKGRVS